MQNQDKRCCVLTVTEAQQLPPTPEIHNLNTNTGSSLVMVYWETTVYSDRPSVHYPPISEFFCQERVFFCIILMIQLWRFSEIACSISIKNIFVIVIKVPKMRGWGNEDSFSKFPVLYGLLERPKRKRCRETVYKKFYSVEPLNAAARFCSSLAEKNWILFSEVSHNFTWPLVLAALIVSFCYFFLSF